MTDKELMQQALDALNLELPSGAYLELKNALRDRLAQPEQEPVAHTTGHCENHKQKGGCQLHNLQCGWPDCDRKPITHSPQRKPLTFEEILAIAEESRKHVYPSIAFARAIEAAHGIKP